MNGRSRVVVESVRAIIIHTEEALKSHFRASFNIAQHTSASAHHRLF